MLNATNRVLGRKVKADRAAVVLHESASLCHSSFGWRPPIGYAPRSLLIALLPNRHFRGVARVQDHRQEAGPGLAARVAGQPVHSPRRFVERFIASSFTEGPGSPAAYPPHRR